METKITRITQSATLDPGTTAFVRVMIVQYMVGTHGPFQIEIPADQFTTERARERVEQEASHIRGLFPA